MTFLCEPFFYEVIDVVSGNTVNSFEKWGDVKAFLRPLDDEDYIVVLLDQNGEAVRVVPKLAATSNVKYQSAQEVEDVMERFARALRGPLGDGQNKRRAGSKPPWYADDSHEAAMLRHMLAYLAGHRVDPDSGCHPLDHLAARALMISCRDRGDVPCPEKPQEPDTGPAEYVEGYRLKLP